MMSKVFFVIVVEQSEVTDMTLSDALRSHDDSRLTFRHSGA